MAEQTTNMGLSKPANGEAGWGAALNQNFDKIDQAAAKAPVRQTVLAGRTSPEGHANFLEAGAGLSVDLKASDKPVLVSAAAGFGEFGPIDLFSQISADRVGAWVLPASSLRFLYLEFGSLGDLSCGSSVYAPIYSFDEPNPGIKDITPLMTSDASPAPFVVSVSSQWSSNYAGWKTLARDTGSPYSNWATANTPYGWWKIDFGSGNRRTLVRYSIKGHATVPSTNPKAWTFEGSNTGLFSGEQVVLDTRTNVSAWANGETKTFDFVNAEGYRYYRFNITENNGNTELDVDEFRFYEAVDETQVNWFDLSDMKMKVKEGGQWVDKRRVFVGEAVTSANSVTSVTTYALQGKYQSGRFAIAANTTYAKNHSLGMIPGSVSRLGALTDGGPLYEFQNVDGNGAYLYGVYVSDIGRTSLKLISGNGGAYVVTQTNGGAIASEACVLVERGW